jgi:branched-chain amino acid transport system ATP-binding protein
MSADEQGRPQQGQAQRGQAQPLLDVRNVHAGYGGLPILSDISVQVAGGECVAVFGPNGAGKTTLMRTISGLLPLTRGSVSIAGSSVGRLAPHQVARLGVAHVPEGRGIFPSLTLKENLFLAVPRGQPRADRERQLTVVLDLFPWLKRRWGQAAGTLSGGEQQMLAIGRGLMSSPRLLMLDEPSLGLSPRIVDETFAALRAIHASDVSILIVEQSVQHAARLATRAYIINRGSVVAEGEPAALLENERINMAYFQ